MKNFSPEAAFAYAEMVNSCVSPECTEDFHEDFKKFMDAYENGDEPAKAIHIESEIAKDATPDEIADIVRSAFVKNPNLLKFGGEIKTNENGNKYIVIFKDEIISGGDFDAHN